jgi:iron complex transport system permease protein
LNAASMLRPDGVGWIRGLKLALLPLSVVVSIVLGASYGAVSTPIPEVVQIILRQLGIPLGHAWPAPQVDIVWTLRLPEVITAVLVGAALSLAGAVFQAVLRNPLADPFVIGTSSGAALGVAVAFVLPAATFTWLGFGTAQIFAFIGSVAAVALVYGLAHVGRQTPTLTFLLAGFAVSTLMVAAMWLVSYESGNQDKVLNWTMGSLGTPGWTQVVTIGSVVVALLAVSLFFVRDLNALLLGEEQAAYLGVHSERSKLVLIGLAALLTSLAVSLAGIIGFVGLVVPHVARLLYGSNHRVVLAASVFLGASYLALSDVAARTLQGSGGELPLGIVTAVVGGPVFLYLLRKSGSSYAF